MPVRLLIVEDDPQTRELVKDFFAEKGYRVTVAVTADAALAHIRKTPPDLVIMDIGLPGFSGLQLCELMRKEPALASIPVMMLTSQDKEAQKIHGLQTGADDYVTKPFSVRELQARAEALLRRARREPSARPVLRSAGIVMDHQSHEVTIKGRPVRLRPKEYALLDLFLRRKGNVLSYQTIAEVVWGDERIVTSQNVIWWVKELRAKLGEFGDRIEAVPKLGYKFNEP